MKILVSIDDTDNIDSRGTGELAAMLAQLLEEQGWGKAQDVTRHQLLVHPDIPYTSHNSCMCFSADIGAAYLETYITYAGEFLKRESAPGSDPGLCIVALENLGSPEKLIAFGYKAKEHIICKEEAYQLAGRLHIHLSEHGGTGQGVIGAMAGAGLRMTGNDGRFRGKFKIRVAGEVASVAEIKHQTGVEVVKSLDGLVLLSNNDRVRLGETVKAVLLDGKSTLLVFPTGVDNPDQVQWQTCSKNQLKVY